MGGGNIARVCGGGGWRVKGRVKERLTLRAPLSGTSKEGSPKPAAGSLGEAV